ncbi:hypothetical protein [Chryseobacterium sp. YIM B08800]|uniref:hypothetical protein n=1 Tax=Chryseobacterium sp. YIM B08800 TaxID=2984136 RepID=UPI0022409CD7|nr:hypothetical protein [Chryseobacterium sp. YIM B08800]
MGRGKPVSGETFPSCDSANQFEGKLSQIENGKISNDIFLFLVICLFSIFRINAEGNYHINVTIQHFLRTVYLYNLGSLISDKKKKEENDSYLKVDAFKKSEAVER